MARCTVRHPKTVTSSLSLLNEEPKTAGVVPRFVVVMVVVRPVLGRFAGARDGSDDRGGADGRGGSDDRATVFGGGTGEAGGSSSDISTVSVDNKKDKERGDKETAVREHVFGWTSFHPSLFSLSLPHTVAVWQLESTTLVRLAVGWPNSSAAWRRTHSRPSVVS